MNELPELEQPKQSEQPEQSEVSKAMTDLARMFVTKDEVRQMVQEIIPRSLVNLDDAAPQGDVLKLSGRVNEIGRAFWGRVVATFDGLIGNITLAVSGAGLKKTTVGTAITLQNTGVTNIAGITGAVGVTTPTGDGITATKNGQNIELRNTGVKKVTGAGGISVSPETGDAVVSVNRYVDGPGGHYPNVKYSFVEFIVQKLPYKAGDWGGNVDESVTDYDDDIWWNSTDTAWLVGRFVTVDATGTKQVRTRNIPISRAASITPASGYGSYIDVVVDVSWNPATATLIQTKQRISFTSGLCQTPSATAPFDITTASECA